MILRRTLYFMKAAVTHLMRHPLYTLAGILTMAMSLILVGFVGLFIWKADAVLDRISGGLKLTVYLGEDTSPGAAQELSALIQDKWPEVVSVTLHSAKEDHKRNLALLPRELLDELDPTLVPAQPYLEVQLSMEGLDEERTRGMVQWFKSLEQVQGVDEVLLGAEKISVAYSLARGARDFGAFLSFVIVLAALFFVLTTTRLIVEGRKEEIEVLLLVGATRNFIRIPHHIEGVLQGLSSGLAAFGGVWILQNRLLAGLRTEALLQVPVNLLPTGMLTWFLAGGVLLGLTGSALGMARYLKLSQ